MAQPDIYQMQVKAENAAYTIYLNGFPVYQGKDAAYGKTTFPVHLYLIGKNNSMTIEVEPLNSSEKAQVVAYIDPFKNGEILELGEGPNSEERLLHIETTNKTSKSKEFDNDVFNFSKTLTQGKVLKEKEVLAYGQRLIEYLTKADAEGFVGEMELKILDYASAHEYTADQMRDGLTGQFKASFFKAPSDDKDNSRLSVESYNDGRVWEIMLDGEEFLKYEEDGGSFQMRVYVAKIDGKLGIVR